MYTENGVLVDLDEVRNVIERADVFTIAFRLFPERLLVDTRFDDVVPDGPSGLPMVAIVDPVESVEERYHWLGEHRPGLGAPREFMFFFWPHSIRFLQESGVWNRLRDRVVASGFPGAADTCEAALRDLARRERDANLAAVRGDRHHTLWSAN